VNGGRIRVAGAQGDARLLDEQLRRLRGLARSARATTEAWNEAEPGRTTIVEVCLTIINLLDRTQPHDLTDLHRAVQSRSRAAHAYVDDTTALADAMVALDTVVVTGGPGSGPAALRDAVPTVLRRLELLTASLRTLSTRASPQAPWVRTIRAVATETEDRLTKLQADVDQHTASDRAPASVGRTDELRALLDRRAFGERCWAEALRAATVLLLLAIASVAWTVLWKAPADAGALALDLAKLTTGITLAVLASYLGRQAGHHRAAATRLRELEIQLTCVGTYFPDDEQQRRRAEIWQRFTTDLPVADGTDAVITDDLATILERLTELVKSLGTVGRG
jgi:hypothetical protein